MLKKVVREMGLVPRGYGVAYYNPFRKGAVCYPIPLNWFVGWWRKVCDYLLRGPKAHALNDRERSLEAREQALQHKTDRLVSDAVAAALKIIDGKTKC